MKVLNYVQTKLASAFEKTIFSGNASRGIFCAPTGTGKTGTARAMLNLYSHRFFNTGVGAGFSVFMTPRILLTDQQSISLADFRIRDEEYPDCEIETYVIHSKSYKSTKRDDLNQAISDAHARGKYLVFLVTYDSADKISFIRPDVIICDEAHTLVGDEFHSVVMNAFAEELPRVFLTATPKEIKGENTKGMNNNKLYGNYLATVSPRVAIERRLIVPPRLHVFEAWKEGKKRSNVVVDQVCHVFNFHQSKSELPAKVLFAMDGVPAIQLIQKHVDLIYSITGAKVFTITAEYGSFIDHERVDREEFLDAISQFEGKSIVCHYSTIGIGIDVDGFTGIALLRGAEQTTAIQTIGRALRVYHGDRDEMGLAKPQEFRIKKSALVTVTVFNGDGSYKSQIKPIIKAMRTSGFDFFKEPIYYSSERGETKQVAEFTNQQLMEKEMEKLRDNVQYELDDVQDELEVEEIYLNGPNWNNSADYTLIA